MAAEYNDGHRDLAQFLFVYPIIEKDTLNEIYNTYIKQHTRDELSVAIKKIRDKLEPLQFTISEDLNFRGSRYYAMHYTNPSAQITMGKDLLEQTTILSHIREILYTSLQRSFEWSCTIDDVSSELIASDKFKKPVEALKEIIQELIEGHWLENDKYIRIGLRSLLCFSDFCDTCEKCKQRVCGESRCVSCNTDYHSNCCPKMCMKCQNSTRN